MADDDPLEVSPPPEGWLEPDDDSPPPEGWLEPDDDSPPPEGWLEPDDDSPPPEGWLEPELALSALELGDALDLLSSFLPLDTTTSITPVDSLYLIEMT